MQLQLINCPAHGLITSTITQSRQPRTDFPVESTNYDVVGSAGWYVVQKSVWSPDPKGRTSFAPTFHQKSPNI